LQRPIFRGASKQEKLQYSAREDYPAQDDAVSSIEVRQDREKTNIIRQESRVEVVVQQSKARVHSSQKIWERNRK
jgi:hypothetical protein